MPQPLEFRKHVVAWVSGREGVLTKARDMLATTHPLTRAGDASNIEPDSARRHAVDVVLASTVALVEPHLAAHVKAHIKAALDEYEMSEGFLPDGAFLEAALVAALDGEVLAALDAVMPYVRQAQREKRNVGEVIAEAICAVPVGDKAKSLAFLGVTVDDVEALAAESRGLRGLRAGDTVEVVSQDPWDEPAQPAADPWDDDTAEVDWNEPAEGPKPEPQTAAPAATRQHKGDAPTAPLQGETPLATACVTALDVLCKKSSATEEDVGKAIGVSRAMMNKYRYRKTTWAPTSEQIASLRTMLLQFYGAFGNATAAIDSARP